MTAQENGKQNHGTKAMYAKWGKESY